MISEAVKICGVHFKNPIISASGTYGFGTEFSRIYDISLLGGISLKGLTFEKRDGNPPPRIAETASGLLNSVGLQNPGVDDFLKFTLPQLKSVDTVLIANIAGNTIEEYIQVAQALKGDTVNLYELNISCPNVKLGGMQFGIQPESVKEVTAAVKAHCDKPLIVKLSPNVADIAENALAAQEGGADGISLINTLTGMAINAHTKRPVFANTVGGLSGPAIKPVALRMVHQVCKAVSIPVIGMGGIMSGTDVAEFMLCGASAVMVGSANIIEPRACPKIIEEFRAYLEEQNMSAAELIGSLKPWKE